MARQDEIQFALTLQNEASVVMKQFQKDVDTAMKGAGVSTDEYSKKVNSLTQWIKEERAEQRQHNFIFNQTKEVVAGASTVLALYGNTLGQTSETQKILTNSLNAGFVAFQGVNNVVGLLSGTFRSLAGPVGLAISLASGVAVAFSQVSSSASESESKIASFEERIKQAQITLGTYTKMMQISDQEMRISEATAKIVELNKATIDLKATIEARGAGQQAWVYKVIGSKEQFAEQQAIIAESSAAIKKLSDELEKGAEKPSVIKKLSIDLDDTKSKFAELFRGQQAYEIESTSSMQQNLMIQNQWSARFTEIDLQNKIKARKKDLADAKASLDAQIEVYGTFANGIRQTYQTVFGEQFSLLLGEQNSVLEIFLGNVGSNLIAWSAQQLSNTILNAIIAQTTAAASIATISAELAAMLTIAGPTALAVNIASFGAAGAAAAISFGTASAAQLAGQTAVSFFHDGGTMAADGSRIPLQSDERHAILRVGETVIPTKPGESYGGGTVLNATININAPGTPVQLVMSALKDVAREIGASTLGDITVNQRSQIAFS